MATARQRAEWQRVGVAVAWAVNCNGFTTAAVQPDDVIPDAYRATPRPAEEPLTEEEKAVQSRVGMRALGAGLTQAAKQAGKNGRN